MMVEVILPTHIRAVPFHMFCPQSHPHCRRRLSGGGGKVPVYEAGQFTCSVCHGLYEGQHHLCPQYQEIPSGGAV